MFSSFSASPLDGGASLASTEFNKSEVMVGCGCKSPRDIISFSKERKIEFLDLAWADEMGLWHHEIVSIQDVSEATILKGISTASGLVLLPDPLSARIALFTQPNTIHMVCSTDASNEGTQGPRSSLKLKQLNPGWVMMISNQVMQSKTPKRGELDLLIHACEVPTSPPRGGGGGGNSGGGIEWKIVRNGGGDSPPYGSPRSPGSPSATVPSSPPGLSVSPPMVFESEETRKRLTTEGIPGVPSGYVPPPLLRPRQVHPTKASRLGLQEKPTKKRKNTENLFCRHCGTKDTPEWRRGPDGRKSLCNACGLHYSKTIKRETLVTPQVQQPRTGNLHFILNPS